MLVWLFIDRIFELRIYSSRLDLSKTVAGAPSTATAPDYRQLAFCGTGLAMWAVQS